MANSEHVAILRQGVETWNRWRESHDLRPDLAETTLENLDLREANLSGARLCRADLKEALLMGADLRGADLSAAYLWRANLTGANLTGADLSHSFMLEADGRLATFERANLCEAQLVDSNMSQARFGNASLTRADLTRVRLHMAHLPGADLTGASMYSTDLWRADLTDANLQGADLRQATFVETEVGGSNLTGSWVYGSSVWEVRGEPKAQLSLNVAPHDVPPLLVDDLEVAQFIYLLVNHRKLRNAINAVTQKGVLILGRFGDGGVEVLQTIADKIREMGYLPIIFDFERPEGRDYTETIITVAGLSRFVIVDLSGPSTPQELYAVVPHLQIPFVPIVNARGGHKAHSMWVDFRKYPWFMGPPLEFLSTEEIVAQLPTKVIAPVEKKLEEIRPASR